MKKQTLLFLSILFLPVAAWAEGLADRVVEHRLFNGLKVLMVERHQVPTISFRIVYKVGGVDEMNGDTGIAHLYEHMAFKGTQRIGTKDFDKEKKILDAMERMNARINKEARKGPEALERLLGELRKEFKLLEEDAGKFVVPNELGAIYDRNGASGFNASTGKDVTTYMVSFPANRLPLWIAVESDRMANTVLREFYKEKEVVLEERRRSVESSPSGKLYEAFIAAAFVAHPYGNPVLGWPSDVKSLSATRTADFFKRYYGPSNTIISIVGDFKVEEVIPLLEKAFAPIHSTAPPPIVVTVEPPQRGERRVEVEDDASPQVIIGYHKPDLHHPDDAVFDVIDSLLSMGRTSRLYKKLVVEKKIAVSASSSAGIPGAKYANLFTFSATPRAPHTTREVEEAIYAELDRLITEPPSEKELQKIITNIDASMIRSLRSNSGLAGRLAYFEAVAGTWRYTLQNRNAIAKVTAEDVVRVAKTYFAKKNRTVATLVKKEQQVEEKGADQ